MLPFRRRALILSVGLLCTFALGLPDVEAGGRGGGRGGGGGGGGGRGGGPGPGGGGGPRSGPGPSMGGGAPRTISGTGGGPRVVGPGPGGKGFIVRPAGGGPPALVRPGPEGRPVIVRPLPNGNKVVIRPGPDGKKVVIRPGHHPHPPHVRPVIRPAFVLGPGDARVAVVEAPLRLVEDPVVVVPMSSGVETLQPQVMRYLHARNDTGEKLTVYLQYRTTNEAGEWAWYPSTPQGGQALSFELAAGQEAYLEHEGWTILASRVRAWAITESGVPLNEYRDRDLWVVDELDGQRLYYAALPETYTLTFAK